MSVLSSLTKTVHDDSISFDTELNTAGKKQTIELFQIKTNLENCNQIKISNPTNTKRLRGTFLWLPTP